MSSGIPIHSARRTVSFAAGDVADADGIKTSFATAASAVDLDASDYNGAAVASSGTIWAKRLPRSVTITLSSSAGSYSTDPIVLTGLRGGIVVTEELEPPDADGNVTLRGVQLFDSPPDIAIPAQENTDGAFTIGVQDIGTPDPAQTFTGAKLHANGTLNVEYMGGHTDAIPCEADTMEPIAALRVLTDPGLAAATTTGLTLYIP